MTLKSKKAVSGIAWGEGSFEMWEGSWGGSNFCKLKMRDDGKNALGGSGGKKKKRLGRGRRRLKSRLPRERMLGGRKDSRKGGTVFPL